MSFKSSWEYNFKITGHHIFRLSWQKGKKKTTFAEGRDHRIPLEWQSSVFLVAAGRLAVELYTAWWYQTLQNGRWKADSGLLLEKVNCSWGPAHLLRHESLSHSGSISCHLVCATLMPTHPCQHELSFTSDSLLNLSPVCHLLWGELAVWCSEHKQDCRAQRPDEMWEEPRGTQCFC